MARTKGSKDLKPRKKTKSKTQFKKGNKVAKGNKSTSAPRITLEKVASQKIDKSVVDRYLTVNSHLTPHELVQRLKLEQVSVLEGMLIKGLLKAYRTGDPHNINFYLDRIIGKVPTRVAHSLENELEGMTDEQLIEEKKKYAGLLREELNELETRPGVAEQIGKFEDVEFKDDDGNIVKAKDVVKSEK